MLWTSRRRSRPPRPQQTADMPRDNAERVVAGARHLSPYLGGRMCPRACWAAVFVRELLPQDLKLEIDRVTARRR